MSVFSEGHRDSKFAGEDFTDKLFYCAKLNTSDQLVLAGNQEIVYGVIVEEGESGDAVSVQTSGIVKVIAGGTVNENARVECNGDGKAVAGTTNSFGIARKGGAANEIIEVLIDRN